MSSVNESDRDAPGRRAGGGSAFLLAQIGAHAAQKFARRITELDLTPPHAGLLRLIARQPGQSQQELARKLGTPASRLVRLVDAVEDRGLVERRRNPDDRRNYALYLTGQGVEFMRSLGRIGAAHEDDICAALSQPERVLLHDLLARIAGQQGLTPGVHPGYRSDQGHRNDQPHPTDTLVPGPPPGKAQAGPPSR